MLFIKLPFKDEFVGFHVCSWGFCLALTFELSSGVLPPLKSFPASGIQQLIFCWYNLNPVQWACLVARKLSDTYSSRLNLQAPTS